MAELKPKSSCNGLLPLTIGTVTMTEITQGQITSVAPFAGAEKQVSDILKPTLGVGFPAAGRRLHKGDTVALWVGPSMALIFGKVPDLQGKAAVVDQTDAQAIGQISGVAAVDILARLVPVDLRRATFKTGRTVRTLIGHMPGSVTRISANVIEVMVMRSMAGTLVHELSVAAKGVAARAETA